MAQLNVCHLLSQCPNQC